MTRIRMRGAALLLASLLLMYPLTADRINAARLGGVMKAYTLRAEGISPEDEAGFFSEAQAYNERLAEKPEALRRHLSDEELEEYSRILDVSGSGIIGRVSSECIALDIPIYHSASESVLQVAAGHLPGSSFPAGGDTEHVVITGHTGLTGARLFTDIDKLEPGDRFVLKVLSRAFVYEVESVTVVLPDELDGIAIREGERLATLVTCTPYGVNTHRLLVTGRLKDVTDAGESEERVSVVEVARKRGMPAEYLMFAAGSLLLTVLAVRAMRGHALKRKGEEGEAR